MPEDYSIVEKDENWDGDVIKYIHNNGNETTVKVGQSCTGGNTDTSVLFLSTSIGCPQNCKFCWLTSKKYPYKRISKETIIYSAFEALDASIDKIKGTYLKLSFMGMGDFCAEDLDYIEIAMEILDYAHESGYVLGIDGVDFATSLPHNYNKRKILKRIVGLDYIITRQYSLGYWKTSHENMYDGNSDYDPSYHRTAVRLFISLHATDTKTRLNLMPGASKYAKFYARLVDDEIDVVYHVMFLDGVNDDTTSINGLKEQRENAELRILRYNKCPGQEMEESRNFDSIIEILKRSVSSRFKYQISTGSEVLAACGQFVCKNL